MDSNERVARMKFAGVYPLLVQKAERKQRTKAEVDEVIRWLTGYDQAGLQKQLDDRRRLRHLFSTRPRPSIRTSPS